MVFFDLNVPYNEDPLKSSSPENITRKNTRLKIMVKAMELGYSGVAYNRSMKGVMSDTDRCTISLFPFSSLLKAKAKATPSSLSNSIKFHRDLLGVPLNSPFRQHTRLTVSVDNSVHAAALNSANPVLKSYDLVAIRPLNQISFENACKVSEVDIIAIDFSEKLPFRLKLPLIKAAIQRGICFEITYSRFISDTQTRRQMVKNAKLLLDWTRGKNLIFSSAAASVNELRGPHDAANLLSLFGLPMERAKSTLSKNCRFMLTSSLRKKQFYKETVRVERILSAKPMDSKEPWLGDRHNWDNISSKGDLMLDDFAKFFSSCSEVPKTSKAIDFASIVEELPSNGLQLKDWLVDGGGKLQSPDDTLPTLSVAKEFVEAANTNIFLNQSNGFEVVFTEKDSMSLAGPPLKHQKFGSQDLDSVLPNDVLANTNESEASPTCYGKPMRSDLGGSVTVGFPSHAWLSASEENPVLPDDSITPLTPVEDTETSHLSKQPKGSTFPKVVSSSEDHVYGLLSPMDTSEQCLPSKEVNVDTKGSTAFDVVSSLKDTSKLSMISKEVDVDPTGSTGPDVISSLKNHVPVTGLVSPVDTPEHCLTSKAADVDPKVSSDIDVVSFSKDHISTTGMVSPMDVSEYYMPSKQDRSSFWNEVSISSMQDIRTKEVFSEAKEREQTDLFSAGSDTLVCRDFSKSRQHGQCMDDSVLTDGKLLQESYDEMQEGTLVADEVLPKKASDTPQNQQECDTKIYCQSLDQSKSGKARIKQRKSLGLIQFPFKRLLRPSRRNPRNCRPR